jgi:uncharacterized protein (TIGR00730 family)
VNGKDLIYLHELLSQPLNINLFFIIKYWFMNNSISRVCVFCSSSEGIEKKYFDAAEVLANEFVANNIAINYGGGAMGLMGIMANTMLSKKGKVKGLIPGFMKEMGWDHPDVSHMVLVNDMHERKYLMRKDVDAIVTLPGGVGTLEELMEVITLKQLGQFTKPIIILNTDNFYTPLIEILKNMANNKFMRDIHTNIWQLVNQPEEVIPAIKNSPAWDVSALKFAHVEKD